jgi:hypothetical protein
MFIAQETVTPDFGLLSSTGILIVSDKFKSFCDHKNVWDYSTALQQLTELVTQHAKIVLGQGISPTQRQRLAETLKFFQTQYDIELCDHVQHRVAKEKVHKAKECNVMVTQPHSLNAQLYQAYLVVDENCAEMSDHQTGEHVQGVILIEAARQMFMACATSYCLCPEASAKIEEMHFTLSEMRVAYHNFIFPIETRIEMEFLGAEVREKTAEGKASIRFYQKEQLCCEVVCTARAFAKKMLKVLETKSARDARRSALMTA